MTAVPAENHPDFAIAAAAQRMASMLPDSPLREPLMAIISPRRQPHVDDFLRMREVQMDEANAVAAAFRRDTRATEFPRLSEIRKGEAIKAARIRRIQERSLDLKREGANPQEIQAFVKSSLTPDILAKAQLDVGTLTNFAQITGGQSLGYVSLDTQMARGTVRPNSFTLYQALNKTRAFQVKDYWAYASDTGGPLPGAAFSGFTTVATGTLATSAGKYQLNNITLALALNGRSITTALAAQNSFVDVAQQENINAALSVMESLNWASYWGNSTLYANQFNGIAASIVSGNIVDFQPWYNTYSALFSSTAQACFNLIYQWAAQITSYNQFGRITHAFMSPTCNGSLQQLVTTLLNNVVTFPNAGMPPQPGGIVVNGDLQGIKTRFGSIQFPVDLYITARDRPAQAILQGDGTNQATTATPTPPASVTVAVTGATANSAWTTAYAAASGVYTYAVASTDASMNESTLTYATAVSGIAAGGAYKVTVTGPVAADATNFRVYRSGLGFSTTAIGATITGYTQNPAAYRYIGTIAAAGSGAVVFTDLNTYIPGSETIFLLDLDEADQALDWRYLLPLTKIELFAQNLYMPWAVTSIGAVRVKVPKFHGMIKNYVSDNPDWNPLAANPTAV